MRTAAVVLALVVAGPALAQTAPGSPPTPADAPVAKTQDQLKTNGDYTMPVQPRGRYSFAPVDEGFLRFDHQDGEVALCKPVNGGWNCDGVADSSLVRQQEIDRLRGEVASLQKEIASLRVTSPPHPLPPDTVPSAEETGSIVLKQDIARARGFIVDTWHRLVDMIDNLRKDVIRKGGDSDLSRT